MANHGHKPNRIYHKTLKELAASGTLAIIKGCAETFFWLPNPQNGEAREWPKKFPQVVAVEYDQEWTKWSVPSKHLVDWLHENGKIGFTAKDVYDQKQVFHIRRERAWVLDVVDEIWKEYGG